MDFQVQKKVKTYTQNYLNTVADFKLKDKNIDLSLLTAVFIRGYETGMRLTKNDIPEFLSTDHIVEDIKNNVVFKNEEEKNQLLQTLDSFSLNVKE